MLGLRNEGKVWQDIQRLIERDLDLEEARLVTGRFPTPREAARRLSRRR